MLRDGVVHPAASAGGRCRRQVSVNRRFRNKREPVDINVAIQKRELAKRRMRRILEPIIAERRQNPEPHDDFLQDFLDTPARSGRQATEEEIFGLIGFGGGAHKCAGMNFANNEMMTITALLFSQFTLELRTPDPGYTYALGAVRPEATWVRYQRAA